MAADFILLQVSDNVQEENKDLQRQAGPPGSYTNYCLMLEEDVVMLALLDSRASKSQKESGGRMHLPPNVIGWNCLAPHSAIKRLSTV